MSRYPVFSCQPDPYIDESEMFKDEEIKNSKQSLLSVILPKMIFEARPSSIFMVRTS